MTAVRQEKEAEQDGFTKSSSMPLGLSLSASASDSMRKSLLLTTPRRTLHRRQHPQTPLQPLSNGKQAGGVASSPSGKDSGGRDMQVSASAPALIKQTKSPSSTFQSNSAFLASADSFSSSAKPRGLKLRPASRGAASASSDGGDSDQGMTASRADLVRLRRRLHQQACECQQIKQELARVKTELFQRCCEADELRLKLTNLERIDGIKSSELLEERRKNDLMSKQVKEMSANLLSLTGSLDGAEGSGLRKRCFKLVQQNTALAVEKSLLQRQKGWAEAKARVLQNEVTRCYLGVNDRVKDESELEQVMHQEFAAPQFPSDDAPIYQLQLPCDSVHREAVVDFVTHLTHTGGQDVKGFLQSSRVYSEGIRNDCLNGLAREFYAAWRRNALLPHILRAVERIVHLQDYLLAFESFASEITSLLGCAHAKIWVVDHLRRIMWTCVRDGNDGQKTFTLNLPRGKNADLTGQSIAAAAYLMQRPVNVADAREDPRFRLEEEAGPDGHAKSILCVPIAKIAKGKQQPQVRVVLEAVNKLREPHFDPDRDGRILKLLGKVSMEVLQVCEKSSGDTLNTKRKEVLLQLLIDCTPCASPTTLFYAIEHGLQEAFLAQAVALHVVVGNSTMSVTMDKHSQRKLVHVACEGMKGIIGLVAKTLNKDTLLSSQVEGTLHDPSVDLPALAKQVIHTVPICEGSGCVAVCQFTCVERDKTMVTDDGAYHPESNHHFHLLNLLLTFVQRHLELVMPQKAQDPLKPSTPVRNQVSEEVSGENNCEEKHDERHSKSKDVKSVHFTQAETLGDDDVGRSDREAAAAKKIQSHQRNRKASAQQEAAKAKADLEKLQMAMSSSAKQKEQKDQELAAAHADVVSLKSEVEKIKLAASESANQHSASIAAASDEISKLKAALEEKTAAVAEAQNNAKEHLAKLQAILSEQQAAREEVQNFGNERAEAEAGHLVAESDAKIEADRKAEQAVTQTLTEAGLRDDAAIARESAVKAETDSDEDMEGQVDTEESEESEIDTASQH